MKISIINFHLNLELTLFCHNKRDICLEKEPLDPDSYL